MLAVGGSFAPALQLCMYLSNPALTVVEHHLVDISFEQLLCPILSVVYDEGWRGVGRMWLTCEQEGQRMQKTSKELQL